MKKKMILVILAVVMVVFASGCGVTHDTNVKRTNGARSVNHINEMTRSIDL